MTRAPRSRRRGRLRSVSARLPPRLRVVPEVAAALIRAAEAAYPEEFCALLLGRPEGLDDEGRDDDGAGTVTRMVTAVNRHPDPRHGFELDPAVLFAALRPEREAERAGRPPPKERVVGHAHSHPDGAAVPSATDRALAHEPGMAWLIVPVRAGRAGTPTAWRAVAEADGRSGLAPLSLDWPEGEGPGADGKDGAATKKP